MKKTMSILVALLLAVLMMTGAVAEPVEEFYMRVPAALTQDEVVHFVAEYKPEKEVLEYGIEVLEPTILGMESLSELIDYVQIHVLPPIGYFTEEVQEKIAALLPENYDLEALHVTEFMSILPEATETTVAVDAEVLLDVDYQPGQLVLVVLGIEDENGEIVWEPLEASVTELGKIEFVIPVELQNTVDGVETLFAVLTEQIGDRGDVLPGQDAPSYSKTAQDMTQVTDVEAEQPVEFEVITVEETELILAELEDMREHTELLQPIFTFFDEETQKAAKFLLPDDVGTDALVAYEVASVMSVGYDEIYGGALVNFVFATPYENDMAVVTLVGLPKEAPAAEEDPMEWTALRTSVTEGQVSVIFDKAVLTAMEEETALMIVLSEPLPVAENN